MFSMVAGALKQVCVPEGSILKGINDCTGI